ncbi:hypothetical protein Esti_004860 [Eimeria stiedai]
MYFLVKWLCIAIVRSFFKEVAVIYKERIPLYGPVIFVGNHNNQFLDACMLVAFIPRQVRFLIATKSLKRKVVGLLARLAKCIGVRRGQDEARKGTGLIRIHNNPQPQQQQQQGEEREASSGGDGVALDAGGVLSGASEASAAAAAEAEKAAHSFSSRWSSLRIQGIGTRFMEEVSPGFTLTTPAGAFHVNHVLSDTELLATADAQPLPLMQRMHRNESMAALAAADSHGAAAAAAGGAEPARRGSLAVRDEGSPRSSRDRELSVQWRHQRPQLLLQQQEQQKHLERHSVAATTATECAVCREESGVSFEDEASGRIKEMLAAAADAADAAAAADLAADEAARVAAALAADAAAAAIEASAAADLAAEAEYAAACASAAVESEKRHMGPLTRQETQHQQEQLQQQQHQRQQHLGEAGLRRRLLHKAATESQAAGDSIAAATFPAAAAARATQGLGPSGAATTASAVAVAAAAAAASAAAEAASAAEAAAAVVSADAVEEIDEVSGPATEFKVAPKIDQSRVYEAVTESLLEGDTIGIFPEGGSHDRTTLLPLKAGVAIMALTAMQQGAEEVLVVPVGLTYHNPHKMQSRASVFIGDPVPVTREMALEYVADRRGATARILNQVERGLRSCIITAQDYEAMGQIRLCASLYPPERLRLAEARYFLLMQLISKVFWRAANDPMLLDLRESIAMYASALESRRLADRQVWLLKQSPSGATLCLAETLVAIVYCAIIGLPLLPLWAPLRIIASILANKQREKAVRESRVKLRGMDVVASYKIMVLLVLVPLFNLIYGAIFGMLFLHTWGELVLSMLTGVVVLPILYYYSMRKAERLLPLIQQLRIVTMVVVGSVNVWRQTDKELITQRLLMQIKVRDVVHQLGPTVSLTFAQDIQRALPTVLLDADTKRLLRLRRQFAPLQMKMSFSGATEVI